jgi:hypothetical protein
MCIQASKRTKQRALAWTVFAQHPRIYELVKLIVENGDARKTPNVPSKHDITELYTKDWSGERMYGPFHNDEWDMAKKLSGAFRSSAIENIYNDEPYGRTAQNLTDHEQGNLVVMYPTGYVRVLNKPGNYFALWQCMCDCEYQKSLYDDTYIQRPCVKTTQELSRGARYCGSNCTHKPKNRKAGKEVDDDLIGKEPPTQEETRMAVNTIMKTLH